MKKIKMSRKQKENRAADLEPIEARSADVVASYEALARLGLTLGGPYVPAARRLEAALKRRKASRDIIRNRLIVELWLRWYRSGVSQRGCEGHRVGHQPLRILDLVQARLRLSRPAAPRSWHAARVVLAHPRRRRRSGFGRPEHPQDPRRGCPN